ncbi:hypothetical protein ES703_116901 [subsurface metagenome]
MIGKCSICGAIIRSRKSSKGTARANFLKAVRKHMWKFHRNTMIARIKAGRKASDENPTVQDFIEALKTAPGRAFMIYQKMRQKDWMVLKRTMDAIETILPIEMKATWKAIEAVHDTLKE